MHEPSKGQKCAVHHVHDHMKEVSHAVMTHTHVQQAGARTQEDVVLRRHGCM